MEIQKTDFVQSLEKGLNVLQAFDSEDVEMTLTEVAKKVDITRANARRILLTLQHLGFVNCRSGKMFSLAPKVLSLGYSYLSSLPFRKLALPYMQELTKELNESCSMSVLDEMDIVYVARVQTKRIMTISLAVGTRLPAISTSMGKVLIAGLNPEEVEKKLAQVEFESYTPKSLSRIDFINQLQEIRSQGWAISDEELEVGVRSLAVPVHDKNNKVIAALNISGHASRVSVKNMKKSYLPALQHTVSEIEKTLTLL
ncbi:IclR family transcriptional regulator C-terminal domain-containing protein [Algoriphagus sp. SE2]|uniref:IclR family transcriptional regulator domain-containing protein n=1 Tax=Algoriphagus sp. SE2 TaxID=3141536 RepID=UPI0031CD8B26